MNYCKGKKDNYEVRLFDAVAKLPQEWNKLIPADHFLQPDQLSLSEQTNLPDVKFLYAFVLLESKPVAVAYFQLLSIKSYHIDTASFSPLQRYGWNAFTGAYHPKLLVAGHLFRHDIASFFAIASLSPFDIYKCYTAAIDAALKKSCANAVLVKDMPETIVTYFQHYAPKYLLLRNDISMEMELDSEWKELKDYEKSLKHKYAQRLRKVRKGWETLDIRELDAAAVEANQEVLFDLYQQVSNKQQVRFGYLSKEYLPALKRKYDQDFHVWLAYENERPVAFFSAWTKDDIFDMFYIGFDYAHNEALQLYFNILFFSVEQAISFQKKKLLLGRTALEAKARIGCKPVYLSTFLYIKNPIVRRVMLQMQQNISHEEGEWENRHPFK